MPVSSALLVVLTALSILFDTTATTVVTRALTSNVATSRPPSALSTGTPFRGRLVNGVRLASESPNYSIQFYSRKNGLVYATDELIRGIEGVAAHLVDEFGPSGRMLLGSMSRKRGGDIPLSRSHNSGRDIDIAFYMQTVDGDPVASKYHNFRSDGQSQQRPRRYRFDAQRNWAMCQALLDDPNLEVQWLILNPSLESLLVEYAHAAGEPKARIQRFQQVTDLPSYAGKHDNHLHVRMQCTPEDWMQGCDPAGPVWPWHRRLRAAMTQTAEPLLRALSTPTRESKLSALDAIAERNLRTVVAQAVPLLDDASTKVRRRARDTVLKLLDEANASDILAATLPLTSRHARAVRKAAQRISPVINAGL